MLENVWQIAYLGASSQDCPILHYRLDNGLDVVLIPDHRAPMVVVDLAYKAGVATEPPGLSGFAHLFEHLMFAGTPSFPDVDAAYGALGVELNASTWDDNTLYYARGMSSALPFILSVEADRMANQGAHIAAEFFEVQRGVVINEIRQNVIDNVAGAAWEAFPTALFARPHPYSRSVYGAIPDLKAATLEDARAFFATGYAPNNAILAVVGDFVADEARRLIEDTFGRVPPGPNIDVAAPEIFPTRARLDLQDRVPTPMLFLGWSVPAIRESDLSLLRIAAEHLGNAEYGVLRERLVDTGLANGAWVHLQQGVLASRFIVQLSAAEGVEAGALEAAAFEAMTGFLDAGITGAELGRARTRIVVDDRVANEDPLRLADNILVFTHATGDPRVALDDDRTIAAASPAGVDTAARRWLDVADASVARVIPGRSGRLPSVLSRRSAPREEIPSPAGRGAVPIPRHPPGRPAASPVPERETVDLGNGLQLLHYHLGQSPLSHVTAASRAGNLAAPAGMEGIIELAAAMSVRGAGERSAADFGRAVRDLGADIDAHTEDLAAFVSLSVPPENLAPATALLVDALFRPRFDAAEFAILKAETLSELSLREHDLADLAARYGEAALFPRRPGQAAIDRSIASTRALARDDAADAFRRMFGPATTTFYSVGPTPAADVAATLRPHLAAWPDVSAPFAPPVREPVTIAAGTRTLVVPEPQTSQVALLVALPAPGPDEPGFAATLAAYRLLNHDFNSRLNALLREERAVTYGTDGGVFDAVRRGSALTIEVLVEREAAGSSVADILGAIADLATEEVREEELERSRVAHLTAMAATGQTGGGLIEEICRRLGHGSSLEEAHRRRMEVVNLDLDAVREAARELAKLERVLVVAAGDPAIIVPQLEAIGLAPEVVARTL